MKNIIQKVKAFVVDRITFSYYKLFRAKKTFQFAEKKYRYFYHQYNYTWRNERAIEIPVFHDFIRHHENENILEVGNVLSHYFPITHDILDKYEKAQGVINEDIVDFNPKKKYDFIISISTLEHVGFDEKPHDPLKFMKALANAKQLLSPSGGILISVPLGYNPFLDVFLKKNKSHFQKLLLLKKVSKNNVWQQTSWEKVKNIIYNVPYPNANVLAIVLLKKNFPRKVDNKRK